MRLLSVSFIRLGAIILLVSFIPPSVHAAPASLIQQPPVKISRLADGFLLVDFGKVAFGNLRLTPPANGSGEITVHFSEASANGRVDRKPPGSVRYSMVKASLANAKSIVVAPPTDERNTLQPAAILTPPEWGVVTPFRWVEIEGWSGELPP